MKYYLPVTEIRLLLKEYISLITDLEMMAEWYEEDMERGVREVKGDVGGGEVKCVGGEGE